MRIRKSGMKYKKHKENPTSFGKGYTPWNKGLKGYMAVSKRWEGHVKIEKLKKEKIVLSNEQKRERHKLEMRNWRGKNREKDREIKHRRKMLKKNAQGSHTWEQWLELKKFYNYMCLCCKKTEPQITLTEDHIIPLIMGGSDNVENLQPLCGRCNTSKYTKTINYRDSLGIGINVDI